MRFQFAGLALALLLCQYAAADSNTEASSEAALPSIRLAPGDDKSGYDSTAYQTNSLSLEHRKGTALNLAAFAIEPQLGLPDPKESLELEPNAAEIALGRRLFFDRRLSRNQTMSCAMCHIPEQGFTSNELKRPVGFEGRSVKRNAPSLLNVRLYERFFVDARETSLAQQAWSPLLASNEMNNPSIGHVLEQINRDPVYQQQFKQAYGKPADMLNVGYALAQYQQSLLAGDAAFDRWKYASDKTALSKSQQAGFELFTGKAACASCHLIGDQYALFTDQQLHNTGAGYQASMLGEQKEITVILAPGIETTIPAEVAQRVGEPKPNDLGRYEVSLNPKDRWKFRTPTLRNVALTAPYMHNGEFLTLKDVVNFYNQGGQAHSALSPLIRPLNLSATEVDNLIAFMQSLTSSKLKLLVADAFAADVQDPE